ncbi:MAG: ribonuclease I [Thiobacillus sp.]
MLLKIGLIVLVWLLPQAARAEAARFDYYLLALSLAPAFCEDEPGRKRKFAQCQRLSEPAFRQTPLTLHGLWPNRADRQHPAYCGRSAHASFCSLPAVSLPGDSRARLARVMPATADCLDRHEWAKHGSCSGLAEADYFAVATALTERVNRALGQELAQHMGRDVSLERLREVLGRTDPALKAAVTFDCQTPRSTVPAKRRPMLREVRVYFARDPRTHEPGQPLAYQQAGRRHFQSGCPGGQAYVDSPLD